jgi:hypothetical protein
VQKNFKLVILAIIVISILPAVVEFLRNRFSRKEAVVPQAAAALGEESPTG